MEVFKDFDNVLILSMYQFVNCFKLENNQRFLKTIDEACHYLYIFGRLKDTAWIFQIHVIRLIKFSFLFLQVEGVEGIMSAYASALQNVTLAGPTLFGQVINKAADIAGHSISDSHAKYYVLLIITVCLEQLVLMFFMSDFIIGLKTFLITPLTGQFHFGLFVAKPVTAFVSVPAFVHLRKLSQWKCRVANSKYDVN